MRVHLTERGWFILIWFLCGLLVGKFVWGADAPPKCLVDPEPKVANSPLTYIRTRVTIEADEHFRMARLVLVDPSGMLRTSFLDTDVRTQWIDWPVRLPAAEYVVALDVWNDQEVIACHAEGRVIVQ